MSIIENARQQTAVWWSRQKQRNDDFGKPVVCDPIEVDCRWDDKIEQFIDAAGSPQMSKAMLMVDADIDFRIGDVLKLGTLKDLTDTVDPKNNENAWEIKAFADTPNLRNTETLKQLIL